MVKLIVMITQKLQKTVFTFTGQKNYIVLCL